MFELYPIANSVLHFFTLLWFWQFLSYFRFGSRIHSDQKHVLRRQLKDRWGLQQVDENLWSKTCYDWSKKWPHRPKFKGNCPIWPRSNYLNSFTVTHHKSKGLLAMPLQNVKTSQQDSLVKIGCRVAHNNPKNLMLRQLRNHRIPLHDSFVMVCIKGLQIFALQVHTVNLIYLYRETLCHKGNSHAQVHVFNLAVVSIMLNYQDVSLSILQLCPVPKN